MTTATTTRANRVSVQANDQGGYTAKFHRTHKLIAVVESQDTVFVPMAGMNKTADREMFRVWVCEHATEYGIQWDPADRRAETNTLPAKYTSDGLLHNSAMMLVSPDVDTWVAKLAGVHEDTEIRMMAIEVDGITPVVEYKKRAVSPKYNNGNWAYASVRVMATMIVGDKEGYVSMDVDLVSGQLKKPSHIGDLGYTYTGFITELARDFPFLTAKKSAEATTPVVITTEPVVDAESHLVPVGPVVDMEADATANTPEYDPTDHTEDLAEETFHVEPSKARRTRKLGAK